MKVVLWIVGIIVVLFVAMMIYGLNAGPSGGDYSHTQDEARAACVRNPDTTAAQCNDPAFLKAAADMATVQDYCRNDPNPKVSICK